MKATIYHNPKCSSSRNTLALLKERGCETDVVEYLKTPPSRDTLENLISAMGIAPRDLLRRNGTPYDQLGLDDPTLTDEQIIDAMMEHPVLIQRPIVATPKGTRLCRPAETVLELL